MKLVHSIRMGAWLSVLLILCMAFGSIWVFLRMAPVIDNIIKQNTRTLVSCEMMLASVARAGAMNGDVGDELAAFDLALAEAKRNVTERNEPEAIAEISRYYRDAFNGDASALKKTVKAIVHLSDINKHAMVVEDVKAKKLGSAGAWGVVFMATAVFLVAMLLLRKVRKNLIIPLEEINSVVESNLKGDNLRRCCGTGLARDVRVLYDRVNEVLDLAGRGRIDRDTDD